MVGEEYLGGRRSTVSFTSRVSFCLDYNCASQVMFFPIMSLFCKRCDLML